MKKPISFIISISLIVTVIFVAVFCANAETDKRELCVNEEYIYEILPDNTITIHYYIGSESNVSVPSYIGNVPVRSIETNAFYGTTAKNLTVSEGITTLKDEAFFYSKNLETVTLPSTLENVGLGVFRDCSKLKTVVFSKNKATLGEYMFYGCTALEEVILPDQITNIPVGMFSYCQSLEKIDLPERLYKISRYAFYSCGLKYISFPFEIAVIQQKAFANNRSLETIYCDDPKAVCVANDAFENCIATFPDHGAPGWPEDPPDTEPVAPIETGSIESTTAPPITDPSLPFTDPTEPTVPVETSGQYEIITNEGFYFGEEEGFQIYESSKITSANDVVRNNKDELLSIAWNVRALGDVNNDNKVNVKDATQIQRFVAYIIDENSPNFNYKNADVNTDGKITVQDATTIQKYVAKVIPSFT